VYQHQASEAKEFAIMNVAHWHSLCDPLIVAFSPVVSNTGAHLAPHSFMVRLLGVTKKTRAIKTKSNLVESIALQIMYIPGVWHSLFLLAQ
jgi:hypothetical protein